MAQPNAIMVLDNPQPKDIVPLTNAGRLVRRTVLDLSEHEFSRLQLMAQMYAASGYNKTKQTEGDYFLVMMKGLELGITPMASIDTINIIMGKPVLDAKGMLALVKSSGLLENIHIDAKDTVCTVTIKRLGNVEQEVSFSLEDAGKMGLKNKDGWQKQPKTMLKWRAVTAAIREVFPDVISGLYTPEELDTEHTTVYEDGTMELSLPAKPQLPEAKRDINNVDAMIFDNQAPVRDEWLEKVKHHCTAFYTHEKYRDNSIEKKLKEGYITRDENPSVTAARMLVYRAMKDANEGGLELQEHEIYAALGYPKVGDFLKQNSDIDNVFDYAWQVLKEYDLQASQQNKVEITDEIPF
jgi:hypothetical protein